VLYIHGGGFRILSKDTHWFAAAKFAAQGFLVANINYRLAPRYPFPAAFEDATRAYAWMCEHGERLGGDMARLILAGESAGANLALALSLAASYSGLGPIAETVYRTQVRPKITLPACGYLQVTQPQRLADASSGLLWPLFFERIVNISDNYLGAEEGDTTLASPLCFLEQHRLPDRPLPASFIAVGDQDPLISDSLRLQNAFDKLKVDSTLRVYPKGKHAFHCFIWTKLAQLCWDDTFAFIHSKLQ